MFLGHLEERFNTIEEKVAAILFHVTAMSQVEKQINELKDQMKTLSNRINAHLVATIDYEMNPHCGICEHCEFKQDDEKSEDDEF